MSPDDAPDLFPCTDMGNAERLVAWHGDELRHVPGWGWLVWNSKVWEQDDKLAAERAKAAVRQIYRSAHNHIDEHKRKALAKHALESEARHRVANMLALASSDPKVRAKVADFDRNPMVLNVRNGTIDLRTGELREHRRDDLLTKIIDLDFDPGVTSTQWEDFLAEATKGKEGLADFLRRAAGYTLTAQTSEEALFLPHGPGGTGKTTFVETLRAVLGPYAGSIRIEVLITSGRTSAGHNEDVARLVGQRMVCAVEASDNERIREGQVKHMTGGDHLSASFKNKSGFDFVPVLKLWLATNEVPYIRPEDSGMWRRVHKIPFENPHPKSNLKADLRKRRNLSAVLAWAVRGCLEWQRGGLQVPACITASTDQLRRRMDGGFEQFLDEHCDLGDEHSWTPTRDVRAAYTRWAVKMDIPDVRRVPDMRLAGTLRRRGCEPEKRRLAGPDTDPMNGWWGVNVLGCTGCTTCTACSHLFSYSPLHEGKVESAGTAGTAGTNGHRQVRIRAGENRWEVVEERTDEVLMDDLPDRDAAVAWATAGGRYEVVK